MRIMMEMLIIIKIITIIVIIMTMPTIIIVSPWLEIFLNYFSSQSFT